MPSSSRPSGRRRPKLILASASPRRKEILRAAGIAFEAFPTHVVELQRRGESARAFVSRMATEKAEAALAATGEHCGRPILGADTVVVIGRKTLGKPASMEDARKMLRQLSGKQHRVLTGLCLIYPAAGFPNARSARKNQSLSLWKRMIRVSSTTVRFRRLRPNEIADYVATGEPMDKAGAYAIQGVASKYVEWIRGCYFNVVGLPVSLLDHMLKESQADGN